MIEKIRNNPRLKQFVIGLISPHNTPGPAFGYAGS